MPDPDWWPSWEGDTLVIVASGPSAGTVPLERARGKARVIAINTSWRLAPWADMLFACDAKWWDRHRGCPEFEGEKLTIERPAAERWGLNMVRCMKPDDRLYLEPKGTVGWGGNSGFHCLNLAVQFGVRRVLMVGYDMQVRGGLHWHGAHPAGMSNPTAANAARWRRAIDGAAKLIREQGVEAINCSPVSALTEYRKAVFEEVI